MKATKYLPGIFFVVMVTVYGPGPSSCNYTTPELDSQIPGQPSKDAEWIIPVAIAVSVGGGAGIIVLVAVTCYRICKKTRKRSQGQHEESAAGNGESAPQTHKKQSNSKGGIVDKTSVTYVNVAFDKATSHTAKAEFQAQRDKALEKLRKIPPEDQDKFNAASNVFAVGYFDQNGGHLSIPNADVHLFIPPGAIEGPCKQEVYIYLTKNIDTDSFTLGNSLHCGPPGLQFHGHVMFSLPLPPGSNEPIEKLWKIVPKQTQTDVGETPEWKPLNESENALFCIEKNGKDCTFFIDHFTCYCLSCKSTFYIGAFIQPSEANTSNYLNLSIRCWKEEQTKKVISMEGEQHSKRIGLEPLCVCTHKGDLHLDIAPVAPGWLLVEPSDGRCQVSLESLERGTTCETSIPLRFMTSSDQTQQPFSCDIHAYQMHNQQTILSVASPKTPEVVKREPNLLPTTVFNAICTNMDSEHNRQTQGTTAKGWPELGKLLGLPDNIISNLSKGVQPDEEAAAGPSLQGAAAPAPITARKAGPTATILGWWEHRNRGGGVKVLEDLQQVFMYLQRPDVSQLLTPIIEGMHGAQNPVDTNPQQPSQIPPKEPIQETHNLCQHVHVPVQQVSGDAEKYPSDELNDDTSRYESRTVNGSARNGVARFLRFISHD